MLLFLANEQFTKFTFDLPKLENCFQKLSHLCLIFYANYTQMRDFFPQK